MEKPGQEAYIEDKLEKASYYAIGAYDTIKKKAKDKRLELEAIAGWPEELKKEKREAKRKLSEYEVVLKELEYVREKTVDTYIQFALRDTALTAHDEDLATEEKSSDIQEQTPWINAYGVYLTAGDLEKLPGFFIRARKECLHVQKICTRLKTMRLHLVALRDMVAPDELRQHTPDEFFGLRECQRVFSEEALNAVLVAKSKADFDAYFKQMERAEKNMKKLRNMLYEGCGNSRCQPRIT